MSFKYFRFYLSESEHYDETELVAVLDWYRWILSARKDRGFIRISFDFTSTDRNISILCESEADIAKEKEEWRRIFNENNITLKKNIEYEVLEDQESVKIHCEHAKGCSRDHQHHHPHQANDDHHAHHDNHWVKAGIGLVFGIGLLILSALSLNIPIIAYYLTTIFSTLVTLYLGHKVYQSAWHALMQKKWDMSTLYTISTTAIIGVSIASMFIPGLPMMLESAPLILGFWHLGETIEHTLLDKINKNLDIRDDAPKKALLKTDAEEISVKQLIPNDVIIIKAGEIIPIDGVLTEPALLYTTRVDGSPYPKQFAAGDTVKSGMCLAKHLTQIEMRVTKTHQNSYLSLIAKNINKANDEKAPVELFANKILKYFVPGLLAVALVCGIILGLLFHPGLAIQCVISVLVSACPCVLSMITPMAVRIGMKKASEQGIHYKDGKTLQAASGIDTVVFDLNGTLTEGEVSINSLEIDDKNRALLKYFLLLETKSTHPIAVKISNYIKEQNVLIDESLEITLVDTSHHSGIKGIVCGETFMIGNKDMLRANGIESINKPYDDVKNGTIYMVRGKEVIGQIALTDHLRQDAKAMIKQLQLMGKRVHMCTGADQATAERYAQSLGIYKDNICANTVGAAASDSEVSKERYIKHLQQQGRRVAMVGDAANDLTAIAQADLGIAVKSSIGDTLTEQHAGMVMQQGVLFPIATAFDVASKTKLNILQNLFVSLSYNAMITLLAAGLFVALGFTLNPAIGVALMVLESAIVLANLYRLKHMETVSLATNIASNHEISQTKDTTSKILNGLSFCPKVSLEKKALSKGESHGHSFGMTSSFGHSRQFFDDSRNNRPHTSIETILDHQCA